MTRLLYAATLGRLVFTPATTEQATTLAVAGPAPRVRFVDAVTQTPVAGRQVWPALAARWDRLAAILRHQHAIEDASCRCRHRRRR